MQRFFCYINPQKEKHKRKNHCPLPHPILHRIPRPVSFTSSEKNDNLNLANPNKKRGEGRSISTHSWLQCTTNPSIQLSFCYSSPTAARLATAPSPTYLVRRASHPSMSSQVHPISVDTGGGGGQTSTSDGGGSTNPSLQRNASNRSNLSTPSPSQRLWKNFSSLGTHRRPSLVIDGDDSQVETTSSPNLQKRRKQAAAAAFSESFKAPSNVTDGLIDSALPARRFQRIAETDPSANQPRSYVEFYKVLTSGHREAHAFLGHEVDPLGFSHTADRLRRRMRKSNFMLLDPSRRKMQYWDFYMLTLLLCAHTPPAHPTCPWVYLPTPPAHGATCPWGYLPT